ncbi:hypothetical protein HDU96_005702 [Phlyctochytrium bullatum]|nr:hypothetical protein HDU96_005702 [Phlyctochytrium bullatum]
MVDHGLDYMDTNILLANVLPPGLAVLASILLLDTYAGHARDVDKALMKPTPQSSKPAALLPSERSSVLGAWVWQVRWRFAMGTKVLGLCSLGELLMAAVLVGCNLIWWLIPVVNTFSPGKRVATPASVTRSVAVWAGWAGMWDGGVAIFFAVRENPLFKSTLGSDPGQYHRTIRFHVFLGYACLFLISLHSIYFLVIYAQANSLALNMLPWNSNKGYLNFAGLIGWSALVLMAATSVFWVRRKSYRLFYWTHQFFILFVFFGLVHYDAGMYIFCGPLLFFVYDRLAPHLRFPRRTRARLHAVNDTTVRVDVELPESFIVAAKYAPGDWANLRFPGVKPSMQWHPFSIASYHPETPDRVVFYVRTRGGWTLDLLRLAREQPAGAPGSGTSVPVLVDGPFGSRHTGYLDRRHFLVVAGGTGLAALLPFAKHYAAANAGRNDRSLHIVWVARTLSDVLVQGQFVRDLPSLVGETGTVQIYLTRDRNPNAAVLSSGLKAGGLNSVLLSKTGHHHRHHKTDDDDVDAWAANQDDSERSEEVDLTNSTEKTSAPQVEYVVAADGFATSFSDGNEEKKDPAVVLAAFRDEDVSSSSSNLQAKNVASEKALAYYKTVVWLRVALAVACFGGGIGGYVFARINAFDYSTSVCNSRTAYQLKGNLHFLCWYWYPAGPVVMAALFALAGGLLTLLAASFLLPTAFSTTKPRSLLSSATFTSTSPLARSSSIPSTPRDSPDHDDASSLGDVYRPATAVPAGVEIVRGQRPDMKVLLGALVDGDKEEAEGQKERVGLMVAGPERMVMDALDAVKTVGKGTVSFHRESFKV